MGIRAETVNGLAKAEASYRSRIRECLRQIKAIQKHIAQVRVGGRKVTARIDRNLKETQTILDRVQATL